jgi:acyl dehydratase
MSFTTPGEDRYFEDYVPGSIHEFGPVSVEQPAVSFFAKCLYPQNPHSDPDAATEKTVFGGVVASDNTNDGLLMRLLADLYLPTAGTLNCQEIDEVRFSRPLCPGDKLIIRVTVIEALRSRFEPDRGNVRSFIEVLNQNREVVMSMNMLKTLLCLPA